MPAVREPGLRRFNESGYEILDSELFTKGEVVIWSIDPSPPRLGDLYTIESRGTVHDVQVDGLTILERGWSARCKLYGFVES
jgi:hypothetical protein